MAASIATHSVLLLAASGQLHYSFGGTVKRTGDSLQGNLVTRLTAPVAEKKLLEADSPRPAAQAAPPNAPTINIPYEVQAAGPPEIINPPESSVSSVAARGEHVATAARDLVYDDFKLGLPFLPPPHYYSSAELDVRPQIRIAPVFDYPELARVTRVAGTIIVELLIDETGKVDEVAVIHAEPAGMFEDAVIAGWRAAHFLPGVKTNASVKSRISLEVNFESPQSGSIGRGSNMRY